MFLWWSGGKRLRAIVVTISTRTRGSTARIVRGMTCGACFVLRRMPVNVRHSLRGGLLRVTRRASRERHFLLLVRLVARGTHRVYLARRERR